MVGDLPPSRVLLVEGADDEHVVQHLCQRHGAMPSFEIIDKKGYPNIERGIGGELKVSGRSALGILVDANDDPAGRWQALADRLRRYEVELPAQMAPTGTIVGDRLRVGVWLMPDNESPGELENFIERLIPEADPVWPRAQRYIDDIPAADRKFRAAKMQRARIHAWLAARAEPRKMGAAIGAGDLQAMAPAAEPFIEWLQQLFD